MTRACGLPELPHGHGKHSASDSGRGVSILQTRSMKRKGRNEHEGSKGILVFSPEHWYIFRTPYHSFPAVPASTDGFRDPELRTADWVSLQILSLYAAGIYPTWPCVQAQRLYYGRETNGHFSGQGKHGRAEYPGVLPAFRLI